MIAVGYDASPSGSDGRVSPTIANRRSLTVPPPGPTPVPGGLGVGVAVGVGESTVVTVEVSPWLPLDDAHPAATTPTISPPSQNSVLRTNMVLLSSSPRDPCRSNRYARARAEKRQPRRPLAIPAAAVGTSRGGARCHTVHRLVSKSPRRSSNLNGLPWPEK